MTLKQAWNKRQALHGKACLLFSKADDEYRGTSLWHAKRAKLTAIAKKLCAEGDLIWINAWIKRHNEDSVIDWNPKF